MDLHSLTKHPDTSEQIEEAPPTYVATNAARVRSWH